MAHNVEFVEPFPILIPDPPRAHAQFSVLWKCINTGDSDSPEMGVHLEFTDASGTPVITSFGRDDAVLGPGQADDDTVGVGAVGAGQGMVTITIGGAQGPSAVIPITVF